ncbi:hypothetical protein MOV08_09585 [Streptomyces yunnanensis]|uniref:Helicase C-terminal domain-containing protein n=1 Tax=Streptomyces yunnanensis TaxID=156453 RepID=A0ABY8A731_9ACTN|nr:helicase-related protein [Streptomyces yunnanensis]WEB39497.1 hypothetical protein MOV08_09585 [Streptomyces yunnanensis]
MLEAVLTRVREDSAQTHIVGLSATVANADQVAAWLGARLIRTSWRPTRLTWQIPMLPALRDGERSTQAVTARTDAAVQLARSFTDEDGSVLVFCSSKRGVRATALALAADRGVPTRGVDADDTERVERLCTSAGVGLHYRDWPFKRETERAFRAREIDVLVATSTVAAGVNLPARAVVVRDVRLGRNRIEVSMVQQMFGRAGRVGAGEREGWAFLLADETERPEWQARLTAGYTVCSRIGDRLPNHLLAEVVQGRVGSMKEAEDWWTDTFAFHQGHDSVEPLHDAALQLAEAGFLRIAPGPQGAEFLEATEPGMLTSRFMVDAELAHELSEAVRGVRVPKDPDHAEALLTELLSIQLPELAEAAFSDRARATLRRVLHHQGRAERLEHDRGLPDKDEGLLPGELAHAVLLLVARRSAAVDVRADGHAAARHPARPAHVACGAGPGRRRPGLDGHHPTARQRALTGALPGTAEAAGHRRRVHLAPRLRARRGTARCGDLPVGRRDDRPVHGGRPVGPPGVPARGPRRPLDGPTGSSGLHPR